MKEMGAFEFPETPEEAREWRPYVRKCALARRVLAVALQHIEGAWACYCDAVPGECHDDEVGAVLDHGTKLPEPVALALFGEFRGVPYAG